jgi:hypothetical protein
MRIFAICLMVSLVGCSVEASSDADDEGSAEHDAALASCGRARYDAANAHYKNAVAWSKLRKAHGACGAEHGMQWEIADEASRAVMTCGDFRSIVRTSTWASPLREALASSLTLRSLDGELAVIKNSAWAKWTGYERFFDKGLSFWARAEGAYGSKVRIDFRAAGKATWNELVMDEATSEISFRASTATYVIGANRTVTVKHDGKSSAYVLGVEDAAEYAAAPVFVLEPKNVTDKKLYSLVGECDA